MYVLIRNFSKFYDLGTVTLSKIVTTVCFLFLVFDNSACNIQFVDSLQENILLTVLNDMTLDDINLYKMVLRNNEQIVYYDKSYIKIYNLNTFELIE